MRRGGEQADISLAAVTKAQQQYSVEIKRTKTEVNKGRRCVRKETEVAQKQPLKMIPEIAPQPGYSNKNLQIASWIKALGYLLSEYHYYCTKHAFESSLKCLFSV